MASTLAAQFGVRAQVTVVPPFGPGIIINPDLTPGVTQTRVDWSVRKGVGGGTPAECAIQAFNLSENSRNRLSGETKRVIDFSDEFDFLDGRLVTGEDLGGTSTVSTGSGFGTLTLSARYQGSSTTAAIFDGTITLARSRHNRHTWVTTITGGDGVLQNTAAIADKFWAGTVSAAEVIEYLVKRVMVAELATSLPPELEGLDMIGGFDATNFYATDILDQLTTLTKTEWWWDDGAVFFSRRGQPLPGPGIRASAGSEEGTVKLIDRPRRIEGGLVVAPMLLLPELRPKTRVTLLSSEFGGEYFASAIEHRGSNRGGVSRTIPTLTPVGVVGLS